MTTILIQVNFTPKNTAKITGFFTWTKTRANLVVSSAVRMLYWFFWSIILKCLLVLLTLFMTHRETPSKTNISVFFIIQAQKEFIINRTRNPQIPTWNWSIIIRFQLIILQFQDKLLFICSSIHTYIPDFILSRIYRVAKKLISSRNLKKKKNLQIIK